MPSQFRCDALPSRKFGIVKTGFTRTFRLLLSEENPEFPKIYLDFYIEHMYDHMRAFVFCVCH